MPPHATFKRKNIRLPVDRYRGRGLFFITLCFHHRRRFGQNPRIASWLVVRLREWSTLCDFLVHAYCVMPDHVHFLAAGAKDTSNLTKFVEGFKQETAVEFARRTRSELWQFKYYDHALRLTDSADGVAWYIWLNPVRKGLCRRPVEYPFEGSFSAVGMKMLSSAAAIDWVPPWKKLNSKSAALKPAALR
ncbi:MAG TPA: transposase [Candidatus Acidoferrum sp.]|nr:transposase [Candidatus Acidoferrum sp.]